MCLGVANRFKPSTSRIYSINVCSKVNQTLVLFILSTLVVARKYPINNVNYLKSDASKIRTRWGSCPENPTLVTWILKRGLFKALLLFACWFADANVMWSLCNVSVADTVMFSFEFDKTRKYPNCLFGTEIWKIASPPPQNYEIETLNWVTRGTLNDLEVKKESIWLLAWCSNIRQNPRCTQWGLNLWKLCQWTPWYPWGGRRMKNVMDALKPHYIAQALFRVWIGHVWGADWTGGGVDSGAYECIVWNKVFWGWIPWCNPQEWSLIDRRNWELRGSSLESGFVRIGIALRHTCNFEQFSTAMQIVVVIAGLRHGNDIITPASNLSFKLLSHLKNLYSINFRIGEVTPPS